MTQARHVPQTSPQMWTRPKAATYADPMAESSDLRRFRLDKETWDAYGELVGNGGRSSDLKAYIDWRLDNPTTPLPGKRRGPVKKIRAGRATEVDVARGGAGKTLDADS